MSLITENKISYEYNKMSANRKAATKYYTDHRWAINKKRLLLKIEKTPGYRPKPKTLIKYGIEITPKESTLDKTTRELEAKAEAKYGKRKLEDLKKEEEIRIAREAPRGVPPPDLSNLTESQKEKRRKKLIVTQKEMHTAFKKLADNDKIAMKTATAYMKKFDQVLEWLGGDSHSNIVALLQNPNEVKEKIIAGMKVKGLSVESSLKDYLTPLMTLCKGGRDYLPAYCSGVDTEAYSKLMGGEITKKQLENIRKTQTAYVVSFSKIEKALKTISKNSPNSIDHLIVLLYNMVPWRDDIGKVQIWRKSGAPPPKGNWYSPQTNKIYLREYKTARKYGPKEYVMTKELKNIFEARDKKKKQNYLIQKPDGTLYNKGKISSLVPKAFEKAGADEPITINAIRHSAVANLYNKGSATNDQKIQLANLMNHDTLTAYTVYTRPDFDDNQSTVKRTRVAKYFDGKLHFGWAGEKDDGWYPVVHDDGDTEDLDDKELKLGIALAKKNKSKDKNKNKLKD